MIWYAIIFSLCVGALISGFLLTLVLSIMAASNFSNQEAGDNEISEDFDGDIDSDIDSGEIDICDDIDVDAEIDIDLDSDIELEADTDIDAGADIESDFEIDEEIDIGNSGESAIATGESDFINFENQTPLSLIFSLYLLWFGAIGTSTYDIFSLQLKWLWFIIILLAPIALVKLISKFWRKISKNSTYRVRTGKNLLGREATVKIAVSADGGVVSVKTAGAVRQIGVKSLHPLSWFHSQTTVYICEYKDGMYFVDDNPASVKLHHLKIQNKVIEISTVKKNKKNNTKN
ncbi:MAG: NfeD family protein [Promethearchaeota archaeon]